MSVRPRLRKAEARGTLRGCEVPSSLARRHRPWV